jgi:hypothetical protein
MKVLAFCPAPEQARAENVQRAALERSLPVLQRIGETVVVRDPAQIAPLEAESRARGEGCLLVCFGPPHAVPGDVACRSVIVDGNATPPRRRAPGAPRRIEVSGALLDSRDYRISAHDFRCHAPIERYCTRAWSGGRQELRFDKESEGTAYLGGFYEPEEWGTWSRIENPWIMLPFALWGSVKMMFCIAAYGRNAGRSIGIQIGSARREHVVWGRFDEECLSFELAEPSHLIQFQGLDTDEIVGAPDHRCMGVGLRYIVLEGSPSGEPPPAPPPVHGRTLEGVVYTALEVDADDLQQSGLRDVIKAFCFTFRGTRDATLVLHVRRPLPQFFARLRSLLYRIGAVGCRIVVLHGELSAPQLRQLIDASTYYLHAPRCEGPSVPLMQFMSSGVPALLASHAPECARVAPAAGFAFDSILESPAWPTPARKEFFLGNHYPCWSSLVAAFAASHRVAKQRRAYARMSRAARDLHAASSADAAIDELLQRFGSDA